MRLTAISAILCAVVAGFTFANGASLAEMSITPSERSIMDSMWDGVNFTELDLALKEDHPHSRMDVIEIIKEYNYRSENHYIETSDGYTIAVQRITGNSKNPSAQGKPVVILEHGLLANSAIWVFAGPEKGLGFILADAGYDVWLGNVRGNKFGRQHKSFKDDDPRFWAFSWHELGTHDLTATIDHILNVTGREKVFYVGYSQGTTMFFTMVTERPEYNDKIQAAFQLAPITYSSRMLHPLYQVLARLEEPIHLLSNLLGIYEFNPSFEFFKMFTSSACKKASINQDICTNIPLMMFGFNKDQMDLKLLPVITAHMGDGSGVKQLVHYAQIIKSGYFRQLDYGVLGNLAIYNRFTPPNYNLKIVTAPVALHYGANDWLAHPQDVNDLYSELQNPIGKFRVPLDSFGHNDFIGAKDVKSLLYDKILTLMSRYKD